MGNALDSKKLKEKADELAKEHNCILWFDVQTIDSQLREEWNSIAEKIKELETALNEISVMDRIRPIKNTPLV